VLFIMNYRAYIGVRDADADAGFAERNLGLGYMYSASEVLSRVAGGDNPAYDAFMKAYGDAADDNTRMKGAMTDLAFWMVLRVCGEAAGPDRAHGRLLFCVGGINAVNPFSASAIKNEILVYSHLVTQAATRLQAVAEGAVYGEDGAPCAVEWEAYAHVYMDFNGSMAFWNDRWLLTMTDLAAANKIRGAFVMGGVRAEEAPVNAPSNASGPFLLNFALSRTFQTLHACWLTAS
jgi:hypothetical protein